MVIKTCDHLTPSTYPTSQIVTYCLPVDQTIHAGQQLVTDILAVGVLQSYFADLYVAWKLILAMVGVSLVISLFYSVLIRYFAGCMVWTMILLLLTLLLVIGVGTAMLSLDV